MEHQGTAKAKTLVEHLNRHPDRHWESSFHKSFFRRHFWESRSSELPSETSTHVSLCRGLERIKNVLIGKVKCCVVINVETFLSVSACKSLSVYCYSVPSLQSGLTTKSCQTCHCPRMEFPLWAGTGSGSIFENTLNLRGEENSLEIM